MELGETPKRQFPDNVLKVLHEKEEIITYLLQDAKNMDSKESMQAAFEVLSSIETKKTILRMRRIASE